MSGPRRQPDVVRMLTLIPWLLERPGTSLQETAAAFAADVPYVAAVVELDEGVRMATRLTGADPATLALDMPVALAFETIGDGFRLPVFTPAAGA
jgi:hypothetical protein